MLVIYLATLAIYLFMFMLQRVVQHPPKWSKPIGTLSVVVFYGVCLVLVFTNGILYAITGFILSLILTTLLPMPKNFFKKFEENN